MKKYIIFGWACGIAGGQIYTSNKCSSLSKNGYDPYVIYAESGIISLPNILNSKHISIPEISFFPSYYTTSERKEIIDGILAFIDKTEDDDVFIESNDVKYAYWAEIVAERLKCKHFMFCLEGYFDYSKHSNREFLLFKLLRKEIAGTRKSSMYDLIGKPFINESNNRFFAAYSTNSVEDVPPKIQIQWDQYDYVFGYVGRASKPCFKAIYKGIYDFCKKHDELKILLFCIGGKKASETYKQVYAQFSDLINAEVLFSDPIFPIPRDYILHLNLSFGSSGSAIVSARLGVKTIRFLDNSYEPQNIIGYHINGFLEKYHDNIPQLIEDILFHQLCDNTPYEMPTKCKDQETIESELQRDSMIMMMSDEEQCYYDTSHIRYQGADWPLKRMFCRSMIFRKTVLLAMKMKRLLHQGVF